MAKGQTHSKREVRKPKKDKAKKPGASSAPGTSQLTDALRKSADAKGKPGGKR